MIRIKSLKLVGLLFQKVRLGLEQALSSPKERLMYYRSFSVNPNQWLIYSYTFHIWSQHTKENWAFLLATSIVYSQF